MYPNLPAQGELIKNKFNLSALFEDNLFCLMIQTAVIQNRVIIGSIAGGLGDCISF